MAAKETKSSTQPRQRLSQADRMAQIARAAAQLFAERGFHAAGTRDLAKASGVSEALLFRYFPNKDELWKAALEACRHNAIADSLRALREQPPSTAGLVALTWELADDYVLDTPKQRAQDRNIIHRMLLRSLAEDGEFARLVRDDLSRLLSKYVVSCLAAARETGDLEISAEESLEILGDLFRLPLFAIGAQRLPTPQLMKGDPDDEALIEALVRFQLRAVGIKQAVIEREIESLKAEGGRRKSRAKRG